MSGGHRAVSLSRIPEERFHSNVGSGNADPQQAAESAGLHYVSDDSPGIRRQRKGKGFAYIDPHGKTVNDQETLLRIQSLVIPPAWEDVWICPSPLGHIQAVGRDQRGRKQYRYHPRFREARDETKYARMMQFVQALPKLRKRVARDLRQPGLSRAKVLAAVVRLLETTLIRVGNEEYAKENHHYGLTTLHNNHARVRGATVQFQFKGKSGVEHAIELSDPRIAKIVRRCQDLPGEELFGYIDADGKAVDLTSTDVNEYLREATGQAFTAKDFRTWAGTVLAAQALKEFEKFDSKAQAKKNIVRAIESVATRLGNTRAVCKKCYIHPAILDSYMDGDLAQTVRQRAARMEKHLSDLRPEEAAVLVLLERRLAAEQRMRETPKSSRRRAA
jgi:DNA topoisomerase-1